MPLKNTVAVERRMDLASLFCMISRHGPAVALAVVAMVSVLAAFIIYRTVRGKRRKATAAAADGDSKSRGEERDAAVIQSSPEESHSSPESTDLSDEGSSNVKEDADLSQGDLKIRHRRATAAAAAAAAVEKKPPPYSPPIKVPEDKHITSDDTVVWDSYKVAETYAEEASEGLLPSDNHSVAEMAAEDAVDCQQGATDETVEDVIEEVCDNYSCLREPELINDDHNKEDEKVVKAECQEDEDVTTDKDDEDKENRQEEENLQCALNNAVLFEQAPNMGEMGDSDSLHDNTITLETNSNLEEPVIHIEDVPAPLICFGKDEEFEEVKSDNIDNSSYASNNGLSPEEEKKDEGEMAEEDCTVYQVIPQQAEICSSTSEPEPEPEEEKKDEGETAEEDCTVYQVIPQQAEICSSTSEPEPEPEEEKKDEGETAEEDCTVYQVIPQQAEICSSTSEQETNQPATQDQSDHVTDTVTQPICDSDWNEDGEQDCEVIQDAVKEDQLNKLEQTVEFDNHPPHFDEQQVEQNEESSLACNQEDVVLNNGADQVKDKMLTTDIVEEYDGSNVALPCSPIKVDNHDDGLSDITTAAKEKMEFPDLWLDCQQPQKKEDDKAPTLDEVTDSTILGPQLPSHETENQPENKGNGMMVLAEECNNEVYDHQQQDQQSVQMIDIEVVDKMSVPADPSTVQSVTPSVIVEEMSCPQLSSICQDQQSNYMEHDETFVATRINSATDAPACDNANITSPIMSEEISHPDILSSSLDQQSDQTKDDEDFSEVTTGAVSVTPEDIIPPICQIHSLSFEQSELRDNGVSSPGVGDESGISSMAVSPDAGNEFDVVAENMVLPVMDCELQSEGQREDKISLFADDIAVSVINGVTAGMVFGPYPSPPSKVPSSESKDWTNYESFAANEDMLGHEIEDAYHREMDQIMAQITDNAASFTNELKIQTDMKIAVEVVEIKEMKAGVSAEKKKDAKAEEKEEDCEKTEISIMEATMDNNEWITESNYPVLPWLIPSAPSFPQDNTKNNQPPTEECQHSSAVTDSACVDTTDIPFCNEVKQTSTLSLVDENMENNKRVVAVQPMPQNVNVTFRIHYFIQSPFQTVAVTGNQQELGNWKDFIPLERAKDGHWSTVVSLPAESHVEWKFVVLDKGEVCRWEECGNRLLDTGYGDDLLVHKWWGHL